MPAPSPPPVCKGRCTVASVIAAVRAKVRGQALKEGGRASLAQRGSDAVKLTIANDFGKGSSLKQSVDGSDAQTMGTSPESERKTQSKTHITSRDDQICAGVNYIDVSPLVNAEPPTRESPDAALSSNKPNNADEVSLHMLQQSHLTTAATAPSKSKTTLSPPPNNTNVNLETNPNDCILSLKNDLYKEIMFAQFKKMYKLEQANGSAAMEVFQTLKEKGGRFCKLQRCGTPQEVDEKVALEKIRADICRRMETSKHWLTQDTRPKQRENLGTNAKRGKGRDTRPELRKHATNARNGERGERGERGDIVLARQSSREGAHQHMAHLLLNKKSKPNHVFVQWLSNDMIEQIPESHVSGLEPRRKDYPVVSYKEETLESEESPLATDSSKFKGSPGSAPGTAGERSKAQKEVVQSEVRGSSGGADGTARGNTSRRGSMPAILESDSAADSEWVTSTGESAAEKMAGGSRPVIKIKQEGSAETCDEWSHIKNEDTDDENNDIKCSPKKAKRLAKVRVGTRVEIYRPQDNGFYPGKLHSHHPPGYNYTVHYEDGVVAKELNLSIQKFKIVKSNNNFVDESSSRKRCRTKEGEREDLEKNMQGIENLTIGRLEVGAMGKHEIAQFISEKRRIEKELVNDKIRLSKTVTEQAEEINNLRKQLKKRDGRKKSSRLEMKDPLHRGQKKHVYHNHVKKEIGFAQKRKKPKLAKDTNLLETKCPTDDRHALPACQNNKCSHDPKASKKYKTVEAANKTENKLNKIAERWLSIGGKDMTLKSFANQEGVCYSTLLQCVNEVKKQKLRNDFRDRKYMSTERLLEFCDQRKNDNRHDLIRMLRTQFNISYEKANYELGKVESYWNSRRK